MFLSLSAIEEKIGAKRRSIATLSDERGEMFAALDDLEAGIAAFESKEQLTAEETVKLEADIKSATTLSSQIRKAGDSIRTAENEIADLEDKRRQREDHNRVQASLQQSVSRPSQRQVNDDVSARVLPPTNEQKDKDISDFLRCSYLGRIHGTSARSVAAGSVVDGFSNERLSAALLKSSNPAVIPENYVPRLIELLGPKTVVRRMTGVRKPPLLNGNLRIPRQTGSGSAAYTSAELANIAVSQQTTDSVTLSEKKLTAMVIASGEIMRHSNPETDRMIRDDLITVVARKEDITFLRSTGASNTPTSIRQLTPGGNVVTMNATVNLANVTADLGYAIGKLTGADSPMLNPYWVFHPRVERYLMDLRDGNGNYAFPEMNSGLLRSFPYLTTSAIPTNLGVGTNRTEIFFVDASELILADSNLFEVQVSIEAAYHDGSNVQAAFSQDAAVFRVLAGHDFNVRHTASLAYINDVTWGA
jgi:HK97 family phage major capsid protein